MMERRNEEIEKLKIFAMLIIVASHFALYTNFDMSQISNCINYFWIQMLSLGGRLGTNLFLLVTGYFMVYKAFKIGRLIRIVLTTFVYSTIILVIFELTGTRIGVINAIKSVFPLSSGLYWFIGAYCMILVLSPLLNHIVLTAPYSILMNTLLGIGILWVLIGGIALGGVSFGYTIQGWAIYIYTRGLHQNI